MTLPRRGGRRRGPPRRIERAAARRIAPADRTTRRIPGTRILIAADAQRDRLERQLRDGAQRQLARVSEHLATAAGLASEHTATELAALDEELVQAAVELDELAQGIHPHALLEGGLGVALPKLVDHAAHPVTLDVNVGRLPAGLEAAVYFVCAEALTNAAKHAAAAAVTVSVRCAGDDVCVEVTDDGAGGADVRGGSGLRGLADRVDALGGVLTIDSPPSAGTRVLATLPHQGAAPPSTTERRRHNHRSVAIMMRTRTTVTLDSATKRLLPHSALTGRRVGARPSRSERSSYL